MTTTPRVSLSLITLRILVTLIITLISQTHAKFFKTDLRWPAFRRAYDDAQPSLTDILAFREPDDDPIFERAMQVVDTLAAQSTCHQTAAAQLLVTCKAVGANMAQDEGKSELLERTKSVYAVRVAVCETGEGRAQVPPMCKPILEIPQRLDHEIDVVNSRNLAPCLGALMVEHYYWTSYSNNRQDANTLCQATTLESTRLEALHSYQKLAALLPEFRAALGSTRSQWLDFLKQQLAEAQQLNNLQRHNRDEYQAGHKADLGSFQDAMKVAKNGLLDVSQNLQRAMASTDSDVAQTREALRHVLADFASLHDLLQETTTKTNEKNAEVAAAQARDMTNVHELAIAATRALENIHADALIQDVHTLIHRLKIDLDQIGIAQSTHLASTQHHLQLSEELSAAQEANLVLGEKMQHSSNYLASELDTANAAARQVSSRLDGVNQALARVEAASTILSSLFAIINLPCQMVQHLHLKLLALFSMPAAVLFFWKPKKYSWSLMAIYVFLESLTSFVEEHRQFVATSLCRLAHQSRVISHSGLWILRKNQALVAAATIIIFCYYLLAVTLIRPKPKPKLKPSLTFNTIRKLDDLTIADRYFTEQRLRSGRRPQYLAERFSRAATVC